MSRRDLSVAIKEAVQRILDNNKDLGKSPRTRTELGQVMGLTRQGISELMGPGGMTLKTVERLAEALGIPAWQLLAPEGTSVADDSLDREPGPREIARVVRWLLRQAGGEDVIRELVEAHSPKIARNMKD